MPVSDMRRIKGAATRASIISYLQKHPDCLGVEISRAVNVSTSLVSQTLNGLKASDDADYTSGLRGRKFWRWIKEGETVCKRKYVSKPAKTRPISDIKRQIEPARSLIL